MTPTKLLIGQILVVFAIVIAGIWAATQWAAAMLAYQPELGPAWLIFLDVPVYRPWQIFAWWYHFDAYAPQVFDKAGTLAGASGFAGCAAAIIGSLWRARQQRHVTTYGSARWAEQREIEKAGLTGHHGVFLGQHRAHYLRHDGPDHVMAFAPTRSGKGVGLVVPTLLSWTGSAVIHDIKGENWQLTAGWRSRFSHVLLFNPTDVCSAHYNPLLEVRRGEHEVRDVQNIADILVDPEGALFLGEYARAADPFTQVGTRSVSVEVTSVVRASPRSFQVKWRESVFGRGSLASTARWTAILTVTVKPPRSAEVLRKNPLGLYVEAIDWSREYEATEAPPVARAGDVAPRAPLESGLANPSLPVAPTIAPPPGGNLP